MISSKIYYIVFLILLTLHLLPAQQIQTKRYTVSDGLIQNQVNTINQDGYGRMWFGTVEGLSVYDGSNFKSITAFNYPIPSNYITTSYFDKKRNILWFGTIDNGMFAIKEDSVFASLPYSSGTKWNRINSIDPVGDKLLISTNNGIGTLNPNSEKVAIKKLPIKDNRINDFAMLNPNLLVFGTLSGVAITDSNFNLLHFVDESSGLQNNFVHNLLRLTKNSVLVATRKGVSKITVEKNINIENYYDPAILPHPFINVLFKSNSGTIWLGSGQGILQFSRDQLKHFRIKDYFYKCIFQDREGNIWFGARGAGAVKLRDEMFINYTLDDGLPNQEILSIYPERDGTTWYGTNKGMFSIEKGKVRSFSIATNSFANIVTDIIRYKDYLYLTTWKGLFVMKGNHFEQIYPKGKSSAFKRFSLLMKYNKKLWVCDRNNVYTLAGNHIEKQSISVGEMIRDIKVLPGGKTLVVAGSKELILLSGEKQTAINSFSSKTNILSIIPTDKSSFYLGTSEGLLYYNGDSISAILPEFSNLNRYEIIGGAFDQRKQLWLGTNTGLIKISEKRMKRYAAFSGIVGDEIITNRSFAADYDGNIHIGTFVGLSICYPEKEQINRIAPEIQITYIELLDRKIRPGKGRVQLSYSENTLNFRFTGISFRDETQLTYQYRLIGLDSTWSGKDKSNSAKFIKLPYENFKFEVRAVNGDNIASPQPATFSFTILPPFYLRTWFILIFLMLSGIIIFYLYKRHMRRIRLENVRLDKLVQQRTKELLSERDKLQSANENLDKRTNELSNILIELQKTQDQLVQSEKLASLGRLIKGIIDEVNNPLTYIYTNTYHLKQYIDRIEKVIDELKDESTADLNADIIQKNEIPYIIDDFKQIINGFDVTLTRVINILENLNSYGIRPTMMEEIDLSAELSNAIYQVKKQFPDIVVDVKGVDNSNAKIKGSGHQLNQVFLAILQNSAEATNGIGNISINLSQNEEGVILCFKDNGSGIKEAIINKIFDPFFTGKDDPKKMGLGLSIAFSIISQHGGNIGVNGNVKNGTEILIKLPA